MTADLRHALRTLAKAPGFAAIAVLTLSIGIAATTSLFGLIKGLVLDPLPYPESHRIGQVWGRHPGSLLDFQPLSTPDFLDLREQLASFEAFGTFAPRRFNVGGAQPLSVEGALCTPGVFPALGVAPLHGRAFTADDGAGDAASAVVILSHGFWQQRFAGDPGCVGQPLRLDGRDHTIVGIMPPQFQLLSLWTRERSLALWTPLALDRADRSRGSYWLSSIARLKPGVSKAQAEADLASVAGRLRELSPDTNARKTFWFMPLQQGLGGLPALRVSVLLGAGWSLLVLAAQNVACMLLARGISRQPEIAVRIALGASRWHITRLVLAESALLAVLAAGGGLLLTLWCQDALSAVLPASVMPRTGLAVDGSILGCIAFLALLIVQMAGLAPALLASKTEVVGGLKEGGISHTSAGKTQRRLRRLVIAQIAIALLLVSLALQLSGTYRQMVAHSQRQVSERILTAAIAVKGHAYDRTTRVDFWNRLIDAAADLPGVLEVGVTSKLPFEGGRGLAVLPDDAPFDPGKPAPHVEMSHVSPGYFGAINAVLLQGRLLTEDDARVRQHAVVINRTLARTWWPNQDPIGHRLRPAHRGVSWSAEIVGIVEDVRQVAEQPARPEMYFPYADDPTEEAFLVLRTAAGAPAPVDALRETLRQIDPDLALARVQSLKRLFDQSGQVFSVVTSVVDGLTVAILGLAALGLYGTLSFTFARRQRDIGVRLALGATPRDVVLLVVRQALTWVAVGVALGAAGSWLLAQLTHAMLDDASPIGLLHLALSVIVVLAAAALATWLPARRATQVNPIEALRAE